jgi:hypothetical protein
MSGNYNIPSKPAYSENCMQLLKQMLMSDPDERLSAD